MATENNGAFEKILSILERIEQYMIEVKERDGKLKESDLLDNQDLCMYLKVSKRTLQRYRRSGLLPFHRIGQKTFYFEQDVKDFMKKWCKGNGR